MSKTTSVERTSNYIKQVKGSVLYKAGAVLASFLAIPVMISYLGVVQFGLWSTLLTIMSWVVFFDLGVGNGLRNKVAESLASGQLKAAQAYTSSAYSMIALIALALWVFFFSVTYFVSWQQVFNTAIIDEHELRYAVQVAMSFMLINFWVGLIVALLGAIQKSALVSLGQLFTNLTALLVVCILNYFNIGGISTLAWLYGFSLVGGNFILTLWFYSRYRYLVPVFSLSRKHVAPLLSVGVQFFVIQLAVLVVFATDKVLIAQFFGPEYVAEYEVVFKLFSVITFFHTLISYPLWSAYTDAYCRGDNKWIRKMLRTQLKVYVFVILSLVLLAFLAEFIINFWIGSVFNVSNSLIGFVAFFVAVSSWNNVFAMILNGMGVVKVQLYTALAAMVLNIPLAFLLVKGFGMGAGGVVLAASISLFFSAVFLPVQVFKLVGRRVC